MLLGTWGCLIDSIAIILKSFVPNSEHLWPLYTFFILVGWTIYAPAQLLVLYSRLHLINRNHNIQRRVLILIILVASLMIVPTWPLVWQAYNPYDSRLSALYSPREAIIDRCTQIGYTVVEIIISAIYISSLAKLLKLKPSVRKRRVMTDLIYVNIIALCLDIIAVVLVFLNRTGISHPVQTFSYILKLKLEFLALNQVMAVAARGLRGDTFEERRYHQHSTSGDDKPSMANENSSEWALPSLQEPQNGGVVNQLVVPSRAFFKVSKTPSFPDTQNAHDANCGNLSTRASSQKHNAKVESAKAEGNNKEEENGVHKW